MSAVDLPSDPDLHEFHVALRGARRESFLSIVALATASGFSGAQLRRFESGLEIPRASQIFLMAAIEIATFDAIEALHVRIMGSPLPRCRKFKLPTDEVVAAVEDLILRARGDLLFDALDEAGRVS